MADFSGFFITWTTYGTWLPGDERGWSKRGKEKQESQPALEHWCKQNKVSGTVVLGKSDRLTVEDAIREHCQVRKWGLPAVNARSSHVHVVVQAYEKATIVRDQLKANNAYNRRVFELIHDEALQGRGIVISLTDCYRLTDYGEPIVALKSYIMSPFSEPENVSAVLDSIWRARQIIASEKR